MAAEIQQLETYSARKSLSPRMELIGLSGVESPYSIGTKLIVEGFRNYEHIGIKESVGCGPSPYDTLDNKLDDLEQNFKQKKILNLNEQIENFNYLTKANPF